MTTYEKDFYAWSKEQSSLLREKEYTKLDIMNLIEEIESLGKSERQTLTSHLTIYFLHRLKIHYQNKMHTRSWDISEKKSLIQSTRCFFA